MATGAEALARSLARAGVGVVVGVPGPHNAALVLQLAEHGIRWVGVHSATAAVLAAGGHGRRRGKPAAALAGPGTIPLAGLPAVAEARAGEVPLLLIDVVAVTPTPPGPPRPAAEEPAPVQGHALSVVRLRSADDVRQVVQQAVEEAVEAPSGPVALELAPGFLAAEARPEPEDDHPVEPVPRPAPPGVEHVQLRRAGNLVDASQNVLVWAGGGALRAGAGGAIAELAEKVGAPVMTTVQAAGLLPARHPCLIGLPAHLPQVGRLWDDADLVVAIGTDFDAESTQGMSMPVPDNLIAINIDAAAAGRSYRPDVLLRGDAKVLTKALSDAVGYRGGTAVVRARLEEIRAAVRRDMAERSPAELAFLDAVSAALPDRAVVVADPSQAGRWLAAFHEWTLPRTLLFPSDVDAIGHALPVAIGAATVPSDDPVVVVVGDQGLLAALGELAVVVREKLPLTVLVVDDGGPGRLRPVLEELGAAAGALDRPSPDFAAAARAFGLRADAVGAEDPPAITEALQAHIAAPDPTVLVVTARLGPPPTDTTRWYRSAEGS